jgi:hypothetical protein
MTKCPYNLKCDQQTALDSTKYDKPVFCVGFPKRPSPRCDTIRLCIIPRKGDLKHQRLGTRKLFDMTPYEAQSLQAIISEICNTHLYNNLRDMKIRKIFHNMPKD